MSHSAHRWLLVAMAVACMIVAVDADGAAVHAQNPGGAEQQLASATGP